MTPPSLVEPLESRIAPAFGAVFELSSLDASNGFAINGIAASDFAGTVSDAGDVNDDGFDDLIIGARHEPPNSSEPGASYVVFGKASGFPTNLELSALDGSNGFKLSGVAAGDQTGFSVSAAGDINGDGIPDVIIGAHFADPNGTSSGASYVVFGKSNGFGANLNLSALDGLNGFKINGTIQGDASGFSVSAAGDVNGDGIEDLIIGATGGGLEGFRSGASYVVFGKASGFVAALDLSTLDGSNGFRISGVAELDRLGSSVSTAGDINGDGFADVIIGASFADSPDFNSGESYVVFGKATGFAPSVNVSSLNGSNGFALGGLPAYDKSGFSVGAAGDVNGDGFGDLIIGAPTDGNRSSAGASYVVFGKGSGFAAHLNLSSLDGSDGFKLSGVVADDYSGCSVDGAGDFNGDGFADLIIGASRADPNGSNSGASYLVFGKASGFEANLNLSSLDGANGFRINGSAAGDSSGRSVSTAGDVNGDGVADLIIGAGGADPNGMLSAGSSYVVFGQRTGAPVLRINDPSLSEGDARGMSFSVILSFVSTAPVTVQYSSLDGTAKADADYTAVTGMLTFAPGETTKTLAVDVLGDTLYEANESFSLILSEPSGASLADATGIGTILNDDAAPVVSIAGDTVLEGNSGTSTLTFIVSLSATSGLAATVNYASADGTATAGSDYTAVTGGTLAFAPGETMKTLTVNVSGDTGIEDHEQFFVALSQASGATIGSGTASGMILNDDTAVSISDVSAAEGNSGLTPFAFTATLEKPSALPVTVNYMTANGTANGGSDYTAVPADLQFTFAPGEIRKTISVDVHGDTDPESDETFSVVLSGPTNASLADATGTGTILDDDAPPQPSIRIDDASVLEGHTGARAITFTVSLSGQYLLPVSVDFASTGGTASPGVDYVALTPGNLLFAPGETSKSISIDVLGDIAVEAGETFSVVLSNPVNATIENAVGIGSILDDDVTLVTPRKATYIDKNGNLATIKISKGALTVEDFTIVPRGMGAELALVDLSGQSEFAGAKLSITARPTNASSSSGLTDVGYINASGVDLGKVMVAGDLGQIDCGDGNAARPALKALVVGSLGTRGLATQAPGTYASLHSDIDGDLRKVLVNGGITGGVTLAVGGRLGNSTIRGDIDAATISALGLLSSRSPSEAIAIGKLAVAGTIAHSRILAGYDRAGATLNPDAGIRQITVDGDWIATSVAAGVADVTGDGFGRNDALIPGDTTPTLLARIASLTIRGTATGSNEGGDHFAITAQQLGRVNINHSKLPLSGAGDEILIDQVRGDITVVDFR